MTLPAVTQTELDGALGILPPSVGDLLAVIGVSSSGTANAPATYGRASALVAAFGDGPLVEAAARHIETTGRPVVVVRTGQTTASTASAVTSVAVGTSVVTITGATSIRDDYEALLVIVNGGTRGVDGITFQWSLDGGRTMSAVTALSVASSFTIPGSGVTFAFAAGTLVAADRYSVRTTAPAPNASELGLAIDALRNTTIAWEIMHIATPLSATLFDTVETAFASIISAGKYRAWIGSTRIPDAGESSATYLSSLSTAFTSKATVFGEVCAGAVRLVSSVTRRSYRRPVSFVVASREASVAQHINIADTNLGPIVGAAIRDANGNPAEHDESVNPGLDDARFTVLRSWEGRAGVFVNRPRILSSLGSDFDLMAKRRVMNLARRATRLYLESRLNRPVLVNATTGFILEADALDIESGCTAALSAVLGDAPKASGWTVVVSRTDNLLSTKTLTVDVRIVPLGYVEFINESIGFQNPALRAV